MLLDSLLSKILINWPKEPERPPLLLNGIGEKEWSLLRDKIVNIFIAQRENSEYPVFNAEGVIQHPDILVLEKERGKQTVEVKQTRKFIGQLSLSCHELPFKLGLIPAAHQLNVQSQNALLKTLEEPIKNRYLILGTISKNKLLPTILSRATIINIRSDRKESDSRNETAGFYEECLRLSPAQRLLKGQEWSKEKTEKIRSFFESIIPELHSQFVSSLSKGQTLKSRELLAELKKALNYAEQLERTSGANPKLLFETFLLRMPKENGGINRE